MEVAHLKHGIGVRNIVWQTNVGLIASASSQDKLVVKRECARNVRMVFGVPIVKRHAAAAASCFATRIQDLALAAPKMVVVARTARISA